MRGRRRHVVGVTDAGRRRMLRGTALPWSQAVCRAAYVLESAPNGVVVQRRFCNPAYR
jgi:hypothetical protein